MKRGKPLRRRTPLRNKSGLRRTPPPGRTPERMPAPREEDEARARELVAVRCGGTCEMCGRAAATDWHHRKPRSQGGQWTADNGLYLCREDHTWVTEHPADSYVLGLLVHRRDDPTAVPVLRRGRTVYLRRDGTMRAGDSKNLPIR